MKINIFIKKTKTDSSYEEAILEYYKRIYPFCKMNFVYFLELNDILKEITETEYIILIDKSSELISSEALSYKIKSITTYESSVINFVVLPDEIKKYEFENFNDIFSISRMNLSTNVIKVILVEQIYRAFTIINGKKYHK